VIWLFVTCSQGIKNLTHEEGVQLAGIDPDYAKKDLYDRIEEGKFPSWTFYVQVSQEFACRPRFASARAWTIFSISRIPMFLPLTSFF
jgi:catalase